jgi:hypothetical protein
MGKNPKAERRKNAGEKVRQTLPTASLLGKAGDMLDWPTLSGAGPMIQTV